MGAETSGSTGEGSTSNVFSRHGGATNSTSYSLPSSLSGLINSEMQMYGGNDDQAKTYLHKMVNMDSTNPGYTNMAKVTTDLDPMGSTYEADTQGQFENRLQKMLAASRTGIENANAPLNRGKEFREAEVINQAARDRRGEVDAHRVSDFGMLNSATQTMNGQGLQAADILQKLKQVNVTGAGQMGQLLGSQNGSTTENFDGQGSQSNTAYQMGGGAGFNFCCFIFLEAYNGVLPWWVRVCRDEFITPRRRAGYVWMSNWLVPAMKRSKIVRWIVNATMIQPLTKWGGWYKKVENYESYAYLKPVVNFWFRVWDLIGKRV